MMQKPSSMWRVCRLHVASAGILALAVVHADSAGIGDDVSFELIRCGEKRLQRHVLLQTAPAS